jgi:hypothetical protein
VNRDAREQHNPNYPENPLLPEHLGSDRSKEHPIVVYLVVTCRRIDPGEYFQIAGHVPNNKENKDQPAYRHRDLLAYR